METIGKLHLRNGQSAQAERTLASLAIEMRVQVGQPGVNIFSAVAAFRTERIFNLSRSVVNIVNEMVLQEKPERAKDARLVHGSDAPF